MQAALVLSIVDKSKRTEQRRKSRVKLENESQRAEKRHLETGRGHRKRFGLTGIINHGPKRSFKGLDLAGGSC